MYKVRRAFCLAAMVCASLIASRPTLAGDKPKLRKASGIGSAFGFVLDATTHQYLSGATVSLLLPADMETVKNSHNNSNDNGYYEIKAPLGDAHSHIAFDRVPDLSIASILSGGGKQVDRVLSASCLNLSVSKSGYKTFYGTVPLEYADADHFRVRLSPVLLMPDTQKYVSYVNPHYLPGKIEDVTLSSQFVSPDDVIQFTVKATGVPLRPDARVNLECMGSKGGDKEVVQRSPHSDIVFRSDYRIDKHSYSKPGVYLIEWRLTNNDYAPVSCGKKDTLFVVGSDPTKRQEISTLFASYNLTNAIPSGSPLVDPDHWKPALLPVSKDFLTKIATLMPPGSDLSSFESVSNASIAPSIPQDEAFYRTNLTVLKNRIARNQQDTYAQILLGDLYYGHRDYDQALELYNVLFQDKSVEKRKDFYPFHNYAALLLRQGKQEEASRYFALALGNAHKDTHDASKATSQVTLQTTSYTVYSGAEDTSVNGFKYLEAVSDQLILENKSAQVPNSSNWLFATLLGDSMNKIGLTGNALTLLEHVAEVQPNEPQVLFALAATEAAAKDYPAALQTVGHGLSLNPNDEDAVILEKKLSAEIAPPKNIPMPSAKTNRPSPTRRHKAKH